jgi:histidinol-phosphate phosphatase family protein
MLHAAWGLALRGHDVRWLGAARPPGALTDPPDLHRARRDAHADVVIGGAGALGAVAWAGAHALTHSAAIDLGGTRPAAWPFGRRAVWGLLDAIGFAEPDVAAVPVEDGDDAWRRASWSDEPLLAEPDVAHDDVERLERACERLTARRRTRGARPALFLDRDGTLVVERGYLAHAEDIELLPGTGRALRALHAAGWALVVVSNQSGVGRGLFPLSRVYEAMARLRRELRHHGIEIDAVYFCPHRPDAGCPCRKPSPELLRRAAANLHLALRESIMVGDKRLDVDTGHAAGARGVLVRTGYGHDEESREEGTSRPPDHVADRLENAVAWLLEQHPATSGEEPRGSAVRR